ncbi:MAG: hypothetical protein AB7D36_07755 [Oscillospiraceae bacterium]
MGKKSGRALWGDRNEILSGEPTKTNGAFLPGAHHPNPVFITRGGPGRGGFAPLKTHIIHKEKEK